MTEHDGTVDALRFGFARRGHTGADHAELVIAGVDPDSTQPREHPVPCQVCRRPTMHQAGCCDDHYELPAAARGALGG